MHPIRKTTSTSGELITDGGPALGLMEDAHYQNVECQLATETSLLTYTDGISEAFNPQKEQYAEKRLLDLISQAQDLSAEALGTLSLADVEQFVGTAKQSDDITLMVIHYGQE